MSAELSLQLQTDNIAGVKSAFSTALTGRSRSTLWWLVDYANNIVYENRLKGADILNIDTNIENINIGSSVFGPWFNMHNAYFSTDQPLGSAITNLRQAIEGVYRWRVSQFFNDIMVTGNSEGVSPLYVFPYPNWDLGHYAATGTATGTFTPGQGAINLTLAGPGVLRVKTTSTIGGANLVMAVTAVFQDGTTTVLAVTVPTTTASGTTLKVGGQALTGAYTAPGSAGVTNVGSTSNFKAGMHVLVQEDMTGTVPFLWKTEVAEVVNVNSSTQLLLRQPTPIGSTTAFANGLRNSYSTSAYVYPLFTNITGVTSSGGTSGDAVDFGFSPDRPQEFIDIATISYPQS